MLGSSSSLRHKLLRRCSIGCWLRRLGCRAPLGLGGALHGAHAPLRRMSTVPVGCANGRRPALCRARRLHVAPSEAQRTAAGVERCSAIDTCGFAGRTGPGPGWRLTPYKTMPWVFGRTPHRAQASPRGGVSWLVQASDRARRWEQGSSGSCPSRPGGATYYCQRLCISVTSCFTCDALGTGHGSCRRRAYSWRRGLWPSATQRSGVASR